MATLEIIGIFFYRNVDCFEKGILWNIFDGSDIVNELVTGWYMAYNSGEELIYI